MYVLFLVAGVFVSGGRDGSIMVWDTRCSTKGNSIQVSNLHFYLCLVRYVMVTRISEILRQDFYSVGYVSIHVCESMNENLVHSAIIALHMNT